MIIRKAAVTDIPRIAELLHQVANVHADIRPDLFKHGARKYTDEQLQDIINNENTPVFTAVEDGVVLGYAFCILQDHTKDNVLTDIKTLYIDDLCVDADLRGKSIGTKLYEHVLRYAEETGCYNVTLNVWEGNDAAKGFYEKSGFKVQKTGMEIIL